MRRAVGVIGILLAALSTAGHAIHGQAAQPVEDLQRRIALLAIEDARNPTAPELRLLADQARGTSGANVTELQRIAIRTLGRLERRETIPILLTLMQDGRLKGSAPSALVVALRAQARETVDREVESAVDAVLRVSDSPWTIALLPFNRPDQVELVEKRLLALLNVRMPPPPPYAAIAGAMEVLARRHRRLHQLQDDSIEFLGKAVRRSLPLLDPNDSDPPKLALAALTAAGRADADLLQTALRDQSEEVRRLAVVALNAGGSGVEASLRTELLDSALRDTAPMVRYEALRGWARSEAKTSGCTPIVAALSDTSIHVVLAAIDALGDLCREDEGVTNTLVSEARTPPTIGDWQREAHAYLALAKRAPDRLETAIPWFAGHLVWQVRMYAARAAAASKDRPTLQRLAFDDNDNVREAALAPLQSLTGAESHAAFIAALGRPDYQLLRTAAMALKDVPADKQLMTALVDALQRVTAEKKETSRDARLALLDRIRAMAGRDQLTLYERLLKDFDPEVAESAAAGCLEAGVTKCVAAPQRLARPPVPTALELAEDLRARVVLDNGRSFELRFNKAVAPLTYTRFVRLARAHYYDGLTFHRVVPNFVIQGGSPGANEYVGDGPFMVDELGGLHKRGTVGISTRGRDTGDAQIFINLVDNPRLDYEYTVFATVGPRDMAEVVDRVVEGTRISRINLVRSAGL